MLATLPNPGNSFYSTSCTIIAALYIAMALEFRWLQPHPDARFPQDPKERRQAVGLLLLMVMVFPVLSGIGLYGAVAALYEGRSATLAELTLAGVAASWIGSVLTSMNVFFKLLGSLVPKRIAKHRKSILVGAGAALIVVGIVLQFRALL